MNTLDIAWLGCERLYGHDHVKNFGIRQKLKERILKVMCEFRPKAIELWV